MKIENKNLQKVVEVMKDGKVSSKSFGWSPDNDEEYKKYKEEETQKKNEASDARYNALKEARMPWFCPECTNVMTRKVDTKMYNIHGKCFNCVIDYEHQLRVTGKYEIYEKSKMVANAISQLKEFRDQFLMALEQSNKEEFIHEDGRIETWDGDPTILNKLKENISKDIEKIEANIEELESDFAKITQELNGK